MNSHLSLFFMALIGSALVACIVQEAHRSLTSKMEAEVEGKDIEITMGMGNVICSAWCLFVFLFVVFAHFWLRASAGWYKLSGFIAIPVGFILLFFALCFLSVPLIHIIWFLRFRPRASTSAAMRNPDNQ